MNAQRGFTLVEVLVALLVLSIMAAMAWQGVDGIVRETFLSSLEVARNVLQALGMDADTAASRVARFRSHDEQLLAEQYLVHDDAAALLQSAQEAREELKLLFQADTDEEADAHGDIR